MGNDQPSDRYFARFPWNCPVAVKTSNFVPLHPKDAPYNIETDPGRIPSFLRQAPATEELLYSDLQIADSGNAPRRLGSGRSGFYRKKYLKGIGRTCLSQNWDSNSRYHSTGHLFPSAAIREYLVSKFLEAKGAGESIVRCEGILLRPLPKDLRGIADRVFDQIKDERRIATIDQFFQAITYKQGNFARASNFNWFLANIELIGSGGSEYSLADFFVLFARFTGDPASDPKDPGDLTPSGLVKRFDGAIARVIDNFGVYFRHGVQWGSYNNNSALDGRFLDLEVPTIYCGPFLGKSGGLRGCEDPRGYSIEGAFHTTMLLRLFIANLRARLSFVLANRLTSPLGDEPFAKEFLREMDRQIHPRKHWLYQKRLFTARFRRVIEDALPLVETRERVWLNRTLDYLWEQFATTPPRQPRESRLERVKKLKMRMEGPHYGYGYALGSLIARADYLEDARWFYAGLDRLERMRDLDRLLTGISKMETEIFARFRGSPA